MTHGVLTEADMEELKKKGIPESFVNSIKYDPPSTADEGESMRKEFMSNTINLYNNLEYQRRKFQLDDKNIIDLYNRYKDPATKSFMGVKWKNNKSSGNDGTPYDKDWSYTDYKFEDVDKDLNDFFTETISVDPNGMPYLTPIGKEITKLGNKGTKEFLRTKGSSDDKVALQQKNIAQYEKDTAYNNRGLLKKAKDATWNTGAAIINNMKNGPIDQQIMTGAGAAYLQPPYRK